MAMATMKSCRDSVEPGSNSALCESNTCVMYETAPYGIPGRNRQARVNTPLLTEPICALARYNVADPPQSVIPVEPSDCELVKARLIRSRPPALRFSGHAAGIRQSSKAV
jgi:hypothetical protein